MEKEYIEREALMKVMLNGLFPNKKIETEFDVLRAIEKAPAADVVEVVRCKDCKYYLPNYCRRVPSSLRYMEANDFCSYGAKMDGKGDKQ